MTPSRSGWRVARPSPAPLAPNLDGLLEEGSDALPVRVTIRQDGVRTGWDDGALGFESDAVWFSGRAFSFRVVADDVLPGTFRCSGLEAVTDVEAWEMGLPLRHPTREVWLEIQLLDVQHDRRLIRGIKRLRAAEGGEGPSQYPPLAPRPGLTHRSYALPIRAAIGSALAGAFILADWAVPYVDHSLTRMLLAVAFALLFLFQRDERSTLRRIAQEEGAA